MRGPSALLGDDDLVVPLETRGCRESAARAVAGEADLDVVADAGATAEDGVSIDADAVQLVVELVSPGNKMMDRKFKPLLYAEAAVPHYWRLEFDPAPRLIVSELDGGRYAEMATALPGTVTRIKEPFPFEIDPAGLAQPQRRG